MEPGFRNVLLVLIVIGIAWAIGGGGAEMKKIKPVKPTSGFEKLESACIIYIQAMPVCASRHSENLPSYLSSSCRDYIYRHIVKAPGC